MVEASLHTLNSGFHTVDRRTAMTRISKISRPLCMRTRKRFLDYPGTLASQLARE
jgi:hypothetical protein